jgi:hypothetical protein
MAGIAIDLSRRPRDVDGVAEVAISGVGVYPGGSEPVAESSDDVE